MAAKSGKQAAGRARRWLLARRIVQYASLLAFVLLFVYAQRGGWPAALVNAPMRLDPLAMLAHLLASRVFLAGSALALVAVLLTLGLGRVWCGWLCPLGTILDLFSLDRRRGNRPAPADSWRGMKYGLLLLVLIAALFSNLTLLILDPLTILYRTLTISIWPALDQVVTMAETGLYRVSWLQSTVAAFDGLVRPHILPPAPIYYRYTLLYAAVFLGIVLLNLIAPRFWCRYLCPLGALLGLLSKPALIRRKVNERCTGCSLCEGVCPTGTIRADQKFASDPGECTMCLECLAACNRQGVTFPLHLSVAGWQPYDPNRRQALAAFGAAAAGVGLLGSDLVAKRENRRLIRPPGAQENNLLDKCVRCGQCMRACPTGAIQSAVTEAGVEGLWTPVVVPSAGYCDYSCNACGQVCPVEAIPALSLPEKREQVIGLAYLDRDRCIAWADGQDCIVCEEMCPVPDKAIILEPAELRTGAGELVTVQQPYVLRDRCLGCGICEYKCPVNGEAAIRVHLPGSAGSI